MLITTNSLNSTSPSLLAALHIAGCQRIHKHFIFFEVKLNQLVVFDGKPKLIMEVLFFAKS